MSDVAKSKPSKPQKVDEVTPSTPPIAEGSVPPSAVGQVTVETQQPGGETQVAHVPASQVRVDPKVNWNSLTGDAPAPAKPARRATRQTRDQRQAKRQEAQRTRAAARQAPKPERPARVEDSEERTLTLTLPARQWAALDRHLQRSGQDASSYFRRALAAFFR